MLIKVYIHKLLKSVNYNQGCGVGVKFHIPNEAVDGNFLIKWSRSRKIIPPTPQPWFKLWFHIDFLFGLSKQFQTCFINLFKKILFEILMATFYKNLFTNEKTKFC